MKNKFITAKEAAAMIHDGDTVLVGGFLGHGTPELIMDEIVANENIHGITVVSNDVAFDEGKDPGQVRPGCVGNSKLLNAHKIKKLINSHMGTNPEAGRQMASGEMEVELNPQGTLVERVRAAGYGLGGILTPTGIGTDVAKGKQVINVDGKDYLLEKPLAGNVAIVRASKVDKFGNCYFNGSTRNFCAVWCMGAPVCIVEAEQVVEVGEIKPEDVHVPGVVVTYIVDGGARK
ncbi:MAG: CoA transferase subunit A [Clostridiaceae bacterium]|nr:CoA transferase subunit A [Clostridiaceae bacterium]